MAGAAKMVEDSLEHSRETRHLLNNHIQITQIKLDGLEKSGQERHDLLVDAGNVRHATVVANLARLENALKWAGSIIISLMLTVLGWAVVQQINANEAQKKDMQQQLELLQAQEIQRRLDQTSAEARAAESAAAARRGIKP